jgi:hypothetical protein
VKNNERSKNVFLDPSPVLHKIIMVIRLGLSLKSNDLQEKIISEIGEGW